MAMLGMQADMQQQSHFPGCYTAWDLNLNANGTVWLTRSSDKILQSKQYCNGTLPPSSDLNIVYNKDLLKQTMLKHEAEFREQIQQLHRLYRRQKELMDEMKKIELCKHHLSLDTLQTNHVLSSKSSNPVQIPQDTSASINLGYRQSPLPEAKDRILPLHSYDGNREQAGHDPTHIEGSPNAPVFVESNCKKFGKKILDLELPAEEYVDSEEEGFSGVKMAPQVAVIPINAIEKIPEVRERDDKELSISGSGCNSVFLQGNYISSLVSSKSKVLADLNVPVKLEDILPELRDFEDPVSEQRDTSLQDLSGKANSNFQVLSKEVIPNSQILRHPEAHVDILPDKRKMQREYVLGNDEAGQSRNNLNSFCQDPHTETLSIEHINDDQVQRDFVTPFGADETKGKLCDGNLKSVARDISASSYKAVATSDKCSSYQVVPLADTMNSESSSVSSWKRDFRRSAIAVQALPCFTGKSSKSFGGNPGPAGNELCVGRKLLSSPKFRSATLPHTSSQNEFQVEGQQPSTSSVSLDRNNNSDSAFEQDSPVKCTKDFKYVMSDKILDLNLPSFSTNVAGSQDASHINGEKTIETSTGHSRQIAETPVNERKSGERRDQSIPPECVLEQANSWCVHDTELEKVVEASNSLGFKRMLKFHMDNEPSSPNGWCSSLASPTRNHPNSCAKEDIKYKEKDRLPDIRLESDNVPDREKQLAITELVAESEPSEKYPGYRMLIDLNSCLSRDESVLMPSRSIEIDLEPPASPENKESSPPRGESNENQLETPLLSSGQGDQDLQDEIVRIAAETLVSISSCEIQTCSESRSCEPFKTTWNNSLYWFARVASSVVDDPGSEFGVSIGFKDHDDCEEYLSDGIDYFEAMTLNLTELKVEEYCFKSNGEKEEERSATFLRDQPKRGRMRRGRQQRKDFQSEILPSLASLSRYEVTEDLQMIGGLMEAAGARWESGSSRNAGRNGYAKGRRRSNARASNVMESTTMNTLQTVSSEVGIQQRRLIEWGKITRRPRGPRCPSSNPRLILGQV